LKRLYGFVLSFALLGLLPTACLYDSGDRCGPHQVTISNDRCACEDNYVPSTSGCVACGENEKSTNGTCVCVVGYGRASPAEACEPIPAELGAECDTDSAPCPEGTAYPLCHATDGTSGYCTNTCASSEDCDGGYKCQEGGEENYCRRPPLGFGDDCDSDEDCAGGEATACEATQSQAVSSVMFAAAFQVISWCACRQRPAYRPTSGCRSNETSRARGVLYERLLV
jgi:hypothetical protein